MLKKFAMFIALSALLQGIAFAADYTTYTDLITVMTTAGVSYKPSNNVAIYYKNDIAASPQKYNIASKNLAGDTVYATSSMSGNIYKWTDTATTPTASGTALGSLLTILPANAGESTGWASGWTAI